MCLQVIETKELSAPMTVYKVVEKRGINKYYSYWLDCIFRDWNNFLGDRECDIKSQIIDLEDESGFLRHNKGIAAGAFHFFITKEDCDKLIKIAKDDHWIMHKNSSLVILECEITGGVALGESGFYSETYKNGTEPFYFDSVCARNYKIIKEL